MKKTQILLIATSSALGASTLLAAGFEKATVWSGRYTGVGSAATSHVRGGESLFFNPAGLARSEGSQGDVQLNYSPTFGQYEGSIVENDASLKSERKQSPVFGATSSYQIAPGLGVGAGFFVSAGSASEYKSISFEDVDSFTNAEMKPDAKSRLSVLEASLGVGYEVLPKLRLGAAWRAAFVKADLASPTVVPITTGPLAGHVFLFGLDLKGMSDKNYSSFRVGAQYGDENWGLGLNARTKLEFSAKGKAGGQAEIVAGGLLNTNGDVGDLDEADVSISSQLPLQIEFGGHAKLTPDLTFFGAYNWSQYSKVKSLAFTGEITTPTEFGIAAGQKVDLSNSPIVTEWKDQHLVKVGLQWDGLENLPLRVGYAWVSQVTPAGYARATFSAPAKGQVYLAGAGYKMTDALQFDAAFEYATATGKVSADDISGDATAKTGTYKTSAFAFHTGLSYLF